MARKRRNLLKRWFSRKAQSSRRERRGLFEPLENRRVLAGDIVLDLAQHADGNDGAADTITARLDPDDTTRLNIEVNGLLALSQSLSNVDTVTINGSNDSDTLVIDSTNGLPQVQINYNAGLGVEDALEMLGLPAGANATYATLPGTEDGKSGINTVIAGDKTLEVRFTGIEPQTFVGAGGTLTLDATSTPATSMLTLSDVGVFNDGVNRVTGDGGFEDTTFSGFDSLVVRGGDGAEIITVEGVDDADPDGGGPGVSLTNITLDADNTGNTDISADTINLQVLPASVTATILGGGGSDDFNLGTIANSIGGLLGNVMIDGEDHDAGSTTLTIGFGSNTLDTGDILNLNDASDAGNFTYTLDATTFTRSGIGTITYNNVETFNLNASLSFGGPTVVDVNNTAAGVNTNITTQNVTGQPSDINVTTTGADSNVIINTSTANDDVNVANVGGDGGDAGFLSSFTRINTSGGNDIFTQQNAAQNAFIEVNLDAGTDTANVHSAQNAALTDINAGDNTDTLNWGNPSNTLTGYAGILQFDGGNHDAGSNSLTIKGETNTLDSGDIVNLNDQGETDDTGYQFQEFGSSILAREGAGGLTYTNTETFNVNTTSGVAAFIGFGSAPGININYNSQDSADTFLFFDGDGIGDDVNFVINSAGGADDFDIDEGGGNGTAGNASFGAFVQVNAGNDNDTFTIDDIAANDRFELNGEAGDDTFNVTPSLGVINVLGGTPAAPSMPGDTLNFTQPGGQTSTLVNQTLDSGTYQTTGGFADVMYDEIESGPPPFALDTEVTLVGTTLTVTDADGGNSNDRLAISFAASTYTIVDTGGLLIDASSIADSTGSGTSTVTVPQASIDSITINTLAGDDTITVNSILPTLSGNFMLAGGTGEDTATINGTIATNGTGNVDIEVTRNILMSSGSRIMTDGGDVTLLANTGGLNGDFVGVGLNNADISTISGNISLTGTGGSTPNDQGVALVSTSTVTSTDGNIMINGTGGPGNNQFQDGILINSGSSVSTSGTGASAGNIIMVGVALTGTNSTTGIEVNGSSISAVDGDISLTGTGGGTGFAASVGVESGNNSTVETTGTGDLTVVGDSLAGTNVPGVRLVNNGKMRASGSGDLSITGTAANAGADIFMDDSTSRIGSALGTGSVNLIADTVDLANGQVLGQGELTLRPRTATATIGLGGGAGTLNLSDSELGRLADGFSGITIGDTAAGTGTVNMTTASFTDPITIAGGTINDAVGTDIAAGTNSVTLDGNVSPGQSPGILTVAGNFVFATGATYEAEIFGAIPGVLHDQIDVTGTVDINNATLNIEDTGFTAVGNEAVVIINNDAADAVTGTFNGLAEGASLTVGGRTFNISYVGGDGNDVVLTAAPFETEVTLVGGTLTIVDVNGGTSNDNLVVFLLGTDYQITDNNSNIIDASTIAGSTGSGTNMVTVPAAGVTGVDVRTLGGDDTLLWLNVAAVDYSVGGISIDGGTGEDSMSFTASQPVTLNNADVTVTSTKEGSVSGAGPFNFTGGNLTINANASGTFPGIGNGASLGATVNITGTGDINVTGRGGNMGGGGLFFGGQVTLSGTGPTAGTITLDGQAGPGTQGSRGITMSNPNAFITSVDGDIMITGVGTDGGDDNYGIEIDDIDRIESTGTGADAATITINGTAGNGAFDNAGLRIFSGDIVSALGNISLTGIGGTADPTSFASAGVSVLRSTVQVDAGNLQINGTANGGIAAGVWLFEGEIASIGNGTVDITATANALGPDMKTQNINNVIGGPMSASPFTINADSIDWANLTVQSTGDLIIQPRTAGTTIGLGGGMGDLNLSDTELGFLVDGFNSITIGDTTGGTGTVDIDTVTFTDPITIAGGTINDAIGTDIAAGTNSVTLDGNVSPGQSPGILTVTGNFVFATGATYEAEIFGAIPGVLHDQIDVTGTVDINSATLNIDDTGFTAAGNEAIVLINNDGVDAVTGTFNGLAEGATLTVGTRTFVISYVGGDGNDVMLTAAPTETEITLVGGTLTVRDVNGGTSDDNLVVFLLGTDYQFTDNGGLIIDASSIPGSTGSGTNMVTVPAAGVTGLDVRTLGGDDMLLWLDVAARDYSVGGISIDGGTGEDTMSYSASMPVNMGNADVTVTATKTASVSGAGPFSFVNGNLTVEGNASGTFPGSTAGTAAALGATVNITGTGNVSVTGRGGALGGAGVLFQGRVTNSATGPTAGTITLDGIAGGTTAGSPGVTMTNPTAFITSVDGDIMITGVGTDGGDDNYGIEIDDIDRIESTGTGADAATITLNGMAGNGAFDNAGLRIFSGDITSALGDISLTGTGGTADPTSFASAGVSVLRSTVQVDMGNLQINGTSNGGTAAGVWLLMGEILSIGNGTVDITGEAAGTSTGPDMKTQNTNNAIGGASSASNFTINADSIDWANLTVQSTGDLIIQPRTAGTTIGLGGGMGDLNLSDTELGFLVDGFNSITIGDTAAGTGTIDIDTVTFTDPITIAGGVINDAIGTDIAAGTNSVTLDGNVAPGQSPGILTVTGNLAFATGATYEAEIFGTIPGVLHDRIDVTGTVDINNAALNIDSTGFTAVGNETFVLISNDAADAITGTFSGLPEGAAVTVGGSMFGISYVGGDGNDVELTPLNADLVITKADSPDPVVAGNQLTYTVTVMNNGPADADDVVVTDTLPAGVTFNSTAGCAESPAAGVPTCTLGTITNGSSKMFTITVDVDPGTTGLITNMASVASSTPLSNTGDDSVSIMTTVNAETDLSITKADTPDPVVAGNDLTYTMTVTNNGPSNSTGGTVSDVLPAGLTFSSSADCAEAGGTVTCAIGALGVGASQMVSFVATVDPSQTAAIANTATIAANETDPTAGNDSATANTTVIGLDFGDAPASYGTATASHGDQGPRLGAERDIEFPANISADAAGDDIDVAPDDEDGVTMLSFIEDVSSMVAIDVRNVTGSATVQGWIDWDANNVFDDPAELVVNQAVAADGVIMVPVTPPVGSVAANPDSETFARFRVSNAGGLTPIDAADEGEVEDYTVSIVCGLEVLNTNDSGGGSLREAINCSNSTPGLDTITFNIPGPGPHTIQPLSTLPIVTDPVIVDGTSEPDFAGTPVVEVDGSLAGAGAHGLQIDAGGSTVRGLAINRFSLNGILLAFAGGNTIQQNMIGTDPSGTTDLGNSIHGVVIFDSPGNMIGGPGANDGNVISGNDAQGVQISRAASTGNVVQGNLIGVAADSVTPLGNERMGVRIDQGASNNTIGGTLPGEGNVIAHQTLLSGVAVADNSTGNAIRRNSMFSNGGLGIDLNGDGTTPNDITAGSEDSDSGPNQLQNAPELSMATLIGTELDLTVFVPSATAHSAFPLTLELFTPDAAGEEGQTFLTEVTYNAATPTVLWMTLDVTGLGLAPGSQIVATATDGAGNTSEFSAPVTVAANNPSLLNLNNDFAFDTGATFHTRITGGTPGTQHDQVAVTGAVDLNNATLDIDDSGFTAVGDEEFVLIDNDGADAVTGTFNGLPEGTQLTVGGEVFELSYAEGDGNDVVLGRACSFLVTRTDDIGFETLRRAIECSNDMAGLDTITFNIPGAGPHTIQPNSALPVVTDPVTIDGTSEPDFAGTPVVEIDGTNAGGGVQGLQIDSGSSTVRGLAINRFSFSGLVLAFGGGNTIQGNMIGTNPAGTAAQGNSSHGLVVFDSPNNTIGGSGANDGNVISGNNLHGVVISRAGSIGNVVQGNLVGVASDAVTPLGNLAGVRIEQTASGNTIGGALLGEGNVIAHQTLQGIAVAGNSTGNRIQRNSTFSNAGLGIDLNADGVTPNDVTAGNEDSDVGPNQLQNAPALSMATLVGTDLDLTVIVPSATAHSAFPLTLELFTPDAAGEEGQTFLTEVTYNAAAPTVLWMTLDVTGLGLAPGSRIVATATDSAGNTSEFSAPVTVAANNPALLNLSNDFAFDTGATFHARITGGTPGAQHDQVAVAGTVDLNNATLDIDDSGFTAIGDEEFVLIDNDGADAVTGTFNGLPEGTRLNVGGEVFELSYVAGDGNDVVLGRACSFLVTRTDDIGFETLRRAIECSNDTAGLDTITFNIPGAGPHTIQPNSALPSVTDPVVIDGTSEPDFAGTPVVELDGTNAGAGSHGLQIDSGGSTVRGLAVNRFGLSGVVLAFGGGNTIQQNVIGTNPAGTAALGNNSHGLVIFESPNNMIGGPGANDGNVISGNNLHGTLVARAGSTGNVVQGNRIGVAADGATPLGNNRMGIRIDQTASNNTIGGVLPGEGNIIAHNATEGVSVINNSTGNAIQRNSTFANGGLGIDLNADGVTANDLPPANEDADTGPNRQQNTPIVINATLNGTDLDVNYGVPSATANSAYPLTVEIFIADAAGQEGETFLEAQTYVLLPPTTIPTITIDVTGLGVSGTTQIVATATDSAGNTSEFSAPVTVSVPLTAASAPVLGADETGAAPGSALLGEELQPIVDAAITRWQRAGADASQLSRLRNAQISFAELEGLHLGLATGNTIQLDADAAGHGWYVDHTPLDDSEFAAPRSSASDAAQQMDLLTAVMHEMGHLLGLDDQLEDAFAEDVMFAWLEAGSRRTP